MQRQAAERQHQATQGFGTLSELRPGDLLVGGGGKRQTGGSKLVWWLARRC